MNKVLAANYY